MREKSSQSMNTNLRKPIFRGGETKVMKKTLSSILVFALVLTMLVPAFAFAADKSTADKFAELKAAGVLDGVNAAGDAGLDQSLTRAQLAKVLVKILERTATPGTGGFADVAETHWAATQGWIVPVKDDLMKGVGNNNFGADQNLTFAELAKVVVEALGLPVDADAKVEGVADWAAPYVAAAVAAGLLPAMENYHAEATRGDLVDATFVVFEAAQVGDLAVKSASATSAKAITVVFNKAVSDTSKVSFSAKRDGANVTFAKTTWNDNKTEATLEVSYKLFAGEYTVTVKVGEDEYVVPAFKVEDEKVTKISFLSDYAVLGTGATTVTTGVKVENQYGEDITNAQSASTLDIVVSKTAGTPNAPTLANGVLTVTAPSPQTFAVDEKLTATLVKGNVVASKTLTVVAAADIASIELGEVTTNEKVKTIYVSTDLTTKSYWLPLTVKDQYGNVVKDLTTLRNNLTVLTSDKNIMDEFAPGDIVTVNNSPALRLKKGNTSPAVKSGLVTITVVSKSCKTASTVIDVKADAKVDTFTVYPPEVIVKSGVEFVLPYTAFDQYGTEVSKAEGGLALAGGSGSPTLTLGPSGSLTTISVTNGTVAY